jgi:hypothetical protein
VERVPTCQTKTLNINKIYPLVFAAQKKGGIHCYLTRFLRPTCAALTIARATTRTGPALLKAFRNILLLAPDRLPQSRQNNSYRGRIFPEGDPQGSSTLLRYSVVGRAECLYRDRPYPRQKETKGSRELSSPSGCGAIGLTIFYLQNWDSNHPRFAPSIPTFFRPVIFFGQEYNTTFWHQSLQTFHTFHMLFLCGIQACCSKDYDFLVLCRVCLSFHSCHTVFNSLDNGSRFGISQPFSPKHGLKAPVS